MKFMIIPDEYKPEAGRLAEDIATWCRNRGIDVEVLEAQSKKIERNKGGQVIVLALGGDGFIMRQSKRLQKARIPLLGINFGRKGILAYAEQSDWEERLLQVLRGEYRIDKRSVLHVQHFGADSKPLHTFEVVNDVYIRHPKRMVILKVAINGAVAHEEVHADGAIVCAPMGSTAYYRTSGGHPFPSGIGINFICPMDMNIGPLVQREDDVIELTLVDVGSFNKESAYLFADGQDVEMQIGEKIVVRASEKKVYFVEPNGLSWFHIAQKKLGLSK